MSKINEKLEDFAHELDSGVGQLNLHLITIKDALTSLCRLREDMDSVDMDNLRFYFTEFHRETRMLNVLLSHSVEGLVEGSQNLGCLSDELTETVREQQKDPTRCNAKDQLS